MNRRWNWACDSLPCCRWVLARWACPGDIPAKAWLRVCWSWAAFFSRVWTTVGYFWQAFGRLSTLFNFMARFSQKAKDLLSSPGECRKCAAKCRCNELVDRNEKTGNTIEYCWGCHRAPIAANLSSPEEDCHSKNYGQPRRDHHRHTTSMPISTNRHIPFSDIGRRKKPRTYQHRKQELHHYEPTCGGHQRKNQHSWLFVYLKEDKKNEKQEKNCCQVSESERRVNNKFFWRHQIPRHQRSACTRSYAHPTVLLDFILRVCLPDGGIFPFSRWCLLGDVDDAGDGIRLDFRGVMHDNIVRATDPNPNCPWFCGTHLCFVGLTTVLCFLIIYLFTVQYRQN